MVAPLTSWVGPRRFPRSGLKHEPKSYTQEYAHRALLTKRRKLRMLVYFHRKDKLFLSENIDDVKMIGRTESSSPMWARFRKEIELEDPTPLVDQEYSGCVQSAATVDEETINTKHEMFQQFPSSDVEGTPKKRTGHHLQKVTSQSYEMKGHSEQCVERFCELAKKSVSRLNHHSKKDDFDEVGELFGFVGAQIVLKCFNQARIGRLGHFADSQDTRKSNHKVEQRRLPVSGKVVTKNCRHFCQFGVRIDTCKMGLNKDAFPA